MNATLVHSCLVTVTFVLGAAPGHGGEFWQHQSAIVGAAVLDDCPMLVTADTSGAIAKWDLRSGKCVFHYLGDQVNVSGFALAPGGRYASVYGMQQNARKHSTVIVDSATGRKVLTLSNRVCWVGPNHLVALAERQDRAEASLWQLHDGQFQPVRTMSLGPLTVHAACFALPDKVVLACSLPKSRNRPRIDSLILYDVSTGRTVARAATIVPLHRIEPSLTISQNPFRVMVSGNCRQAELFEGEQLKQVRQIEIAADRPSFRVGALSPNGRLACLAKGRVELFDVPNGKLTLLDRGNEECMEVPLPHSADPLGSALARHFLTYCALHFTSDNKMLVGVTGTGQVFLWDVHLRKRLRTLFVVAQE